MPHLVAGRGFFYVAALVSSRENGQVILSRVSNLVVCSSISIVETEMPILIRADGNVAIPDPIVIHTVRTPKIPSARNSIAVVRNVQSVCCSHRRHFGKVIEEIRFQNRATIGESLGCVSQPVGSNCASYVSCVVNNAVWTYPVHDADSKSILRKLLMIR